VDRLLKNKNHLQNDGVVNIQEELVNEIENSSQLTFIQLLNLSI